MPIPKSALVRRRSSIAGWGVYTRQRITKNSRIVDYAGEKITSEESIRREEKQLPRGEIWGFTINRRWVRDGSVNGSIARFINHSCRPNCYVEISGDTIWIRASRNIEAGEELNYDYNTNGLAAIPCRCRPGCKRKL